MESVVNTWVPAWTHEVSVREQPYECDLYVKLNDSAISLTYSHGDNFEIVIRDEKIIDDPGLSEEDWHFDSAPLPVLGSFHGAMHECEMCGASDGAAEYVVGVSDRFWYVYTYGGCFEGVCHTSEIDSQTAEDTVAGFSLRPTEDYPSYYDDEEWEYDEIGTETVTT